MVLELLKDVKLFEVVSTFIKIITIQYSILLNLNFLQKLTSQSSYAAIKESSESPIKTPNCKNLPSAAMVNKRLEKVFQ